MPRQFQRFEENRQARYLKKEPKNGSAASKHQCMENIKRILGHVHMQELEREPFTRGRTAEPTVVPMLRVPIADRLKSVGHRDR
jgi:hypothetical protein